MLVEDNDSGMTSRRLGLPWQSVVIKFDVNKCGKRSATHRDKGVDWSCCGSRHNSGGFSDEFETYAIQGLEITERN